MKFLRINLTVSAIAFFLIGLLGCNIQETTPSILATEGINQELVKEVAAISEYQVQKIAFTQMLTNEEKTYVFKKRIIEKLETLSLTVEQKDHLNLLLANMTPEVYNTGSAKGVESMRFLSEWTKKGKVIFGEGALFDIVASLSPGNTTKDGGPSTNKTAPPPSVVCGCATSSDYCADGYACTYIPSCNKPGCGTFYAYTCNGVCDRVL